MKRLLDNLNHQEDSHVLPFFWLHGEEENVLRSYMARMAESGIRSLCLEARPHKDFLKDGWWHDLDIIFDEAEKRGMKVWILDDSHFPTGYANGMIKDVYPQYRKRFLACRQLDFAGPLKFGQVNVSYAFKDKEDELIGVYLAKKKGFNAIDPDTLRDITGQVYDLNVHSETNIPFASIVHKAVNVDIPEGEWRILILTSTFMGSEKETENYLNPIDPQAVDVLINTVYEAHYARYHHLFGTIIQGFFSDEPRFGNVHGSEGSIGRKEMVLPWRRDMKDLLTEDIRKKKINIDTSLYLPLLFVDGGEKSHQIRYAYMDLVSELYAENFSVRIGKWCEDRGVRYIGHTIEDNNSHARLGYGAGHFYKAMRGQHFAGIDVVIHQLMPGMDHTYNRALTANGWDGEFFHYMLGKLGGSLSQLDPKKKGNAMCEVFGAYGWAEGNRLMKWITDYMLVRGINEFVPHAFNAAAYPDPDCPPHFYAHGKNPQYEDFGLLIRYMNRMAHLLHDGRPEVTAALLYHGEAEWSGEYMLSQKPAAEMARNQIDYLIVPCADLLNAEINADTFTISNNAFSCLVIPYAEALPFALIEKITEIAEQGIPVYFCGELMERSSEGHDISSLRKRLEKTVCFTSPEQLATHQKKDGFCRYELSSYEPYLRTYRYHETDGTVLMITNEGLKEINCTMKTDLKSYTYRYDAFENRLFHQTVRNGLIDINLSPYESLVLILCDEELCAETNRSIDSADIKKLKGPFRLSFCGAGEKEYRDELILDQLKPVNLIPGKENFCGRIKYEVSFDMNEPTPAYICLDTVYESAHVCLNGQKEHFRISRPYRFDITDDLRPGENKLVIETTTTAVRDNYDFLSQFIALEPTGITESIYLETGRKDK